MPLSRRYAIQRNTFSGFAFIALPATAFDVPKREKLSQTLPFRLSEGLRKRLEEQAAQQERTAGALLRRYLIEGLERDEEKAAKRQRN